MSSPEQLATFLGWCTVINFGVILLALAFIAIAHDWLGRVSAGIFGVTEEEAKVTVFRTFQQFRIAVLVLNFIPWVALKVMT